MSEKPLQQQILENLQLKDTNQLLQIWQENKRDEWSDLTFDLIEQILQERGVEIPAQNHPELELETEEDIEDITDDAFDSISQPVFYKPQEALWFVEATSIAAWVVLGMYIVVGLWYFTSNWSTYGETHIFISAVISFFSRILNGVINFILLKGISFILSVLLEFEFNTRIKNGTDISA